MIPRGLAAAGAACLLAIPALCGSADYREEHHPAHVVEHRGNHVVIRRQPELITRIWGLAGDVALAELIAATSHPRALAAIGAVESGYDPQAVGSRGERGIYQVRPDIWGEVPDDPVDQTRQAEEILERLVREHGSIAEGIRRYNGGGPASRRYLRKVQAVMNTL